MKQYLYIVNPDNFRGHVENTMPYVDINTKHGEELLQSTFVHYTDETFAKYNERKGGGLIALDWDSFSIQYYEPYIKGLQKAWCEVDKEHYWDMLECLPPCNWHDLDSRWNVFYISEAYTDRLHSHLVKDNVNGKYYEALRSCFITDEELIKQLNEL
jgi:hypothetical protein